MGYIATHRVKIEEPTDIVCSQSSSESAFEFEALPVEAQMTDQRAILVADINNDQRKDILLGGNQYKAKPELGIRFWALRFATNRKERATMRKEIFE